MSSAPIKPVALVTGGTSGIGRATALAYAKAGYRVVVAGRREAEGQHVVDEITKAGGESRFVRTDVTKEAEVAALVESTLTAYGRLDAAFNNAGIEGATGKRTHEATVEDFRAVMDANVLGVLLSMKHEIPALLRSGGGAIVNTSSVAGVIAMPTASVYTASKHAVIGLTKTAALEYAKEGVRVNAVNPAATQSDMLDRFTGGADSDFRKQLAAMHPIGRIAQAEEIADAVVFLSSPKASFITGQALSIDGGWTAQ
ncbi:MAG TPA: SDR family oxidoreductase [Planctomycetota bacterium]|nr:SDR family oxidoreductase [Planctomycetota bacterium]